MVHEVSSKADFDSQLSAAGDKLVVVDFFATWCGPCKMIAPKLQQMSIEMPDVVFLKVDVDDVEEVATIYSIRAMPTFIFFKNGNKLEEFPGANAEKIRETIAKHK